MVKGRPELIDNLTGKDRDLRWWLYQEVNLFFSVHIFDEVIRVRSGSKGAHNFLDCFKVFRRADDFETGGVKATNHVRNSTTGLIK